MERDERKKIRWKSVDPDKQDGFTFNEQVTGDVHQITTRTNLFGKTFLYCLAARVTKTIAFTHLLLR